MLSVREREKALQRCACGMVIQDQPSFLISTLQGHTMFFIETSGIQKSNMFLDTEVDLYTKVVFQYIMD